jgi:hypothetical protein
MTVLRNVGVVIAAAALFGATSSLAQNADQASANQAAAAYVDQLDAADLGEVYDQDMADVFRAVMTRKAFIDLISIARIQAGGVHTAREFVGASAFDHLPTGQTGEFYFVRFKTRFPNGVVFQDVYLQKVGASWKVAASLASPAPP